jgi:hypothetical protein
MKKRLLIFLWILCSTTSSVVYSQAGGSASARPDNIRLTWSENPKTTQTIGWRTDSTIAAGKVSTPRQVSRL